MDQVDFNHNTQRAAFGFHMCFCNILWLVDVAYQLQHGSVQLPNN